MGDKRYKAVIDEYGAAGVNYCHAVQQHDSAMKDKSSPNAAEDQVDAGRRLNNAKQTLTDLGFWSFPKCGP